MCLQLTHPCLSLRSVTPADEALLYTVYASTREQEMRQVPQWTAAQKEAFLKQQFMAQHSWYQQQYQGAFFYIIESNKVPVGRLYIDPAFGDGSVRIIDISLLPLFRGNGYGTAILQDIMELAQRCARTITIHVESFNPAMQLYHRLGFILKDRKNNVHLLLEWKASAAQAA